MHLFHIFIKHLQTLLEKGLEMFYEYKPHTEPHNLAYKYFCNGNMSIHIK